ncbi:hypothetical protein AKJ16_DCAP06020 [Drosera capensis]
MTEQTLSVKKGLDLCIPRECCDESDPQPESKQRHLGRISDKYWEQRRTSSPSCNVLASQLPGIVPQTVNVDLVSIYCMTTIILSSTSLSTS